MANYIEVRNAARLDKICKEIAKRVNSIEGNEYTQHFGFGNVTGQRALGCVGREDDDSQTSSFVIGPDGHFYASWYVAWGERLSWQVQLPETFDDEKIISVIVGIMGA